MQQNEAPLRFLRRRQVEAKTGLSRSTIYQLMYAGDFPKQVKLGSGMAVAWVESEVDQWMRDRVTERNTPNHRM